MIRPWIERFNAVWLVDFEFHQPDGERPTPICMVAKEYHSGRVLRYWSDGLTARTSAPFPTDADALFVAYYSSAELGCFLSLGWPLPLRVLDLFTEFRCLTNGVAVPCGNNLLGALAYYGIDGMASVEKDAMRELAICGGPYTSDERRALTDYCESDVIALAKLLPAMTPKIDIARALLRGRYMAAAARIESAGVPIDVQTLNCLKENWSSIQDRLIVEVDRDYGVYEGRTFKAERFAGWLAQAGIPWPCLESGALDLSDEVFRQAARQYRVVAPLRELRHTLSQLRLNDLAVGSDGRNRCLLSAFRARTSRNQPSNSRFIFGPSCWLRGLIRPRSDRALAYIDWSGQEYGIAASLSGDPKMLVDYQSGDPYLGFGKRVGLVPASATRSSHKAIRDQLKVALGLGAMYGAGPGTVASATGLQLAVAREMLRLHRESYPTYWRWSENALNHAMLQGWLQTVFGWRVHVGPECNPRSLTNFPMQANGAEMLRVACCLATERGIMVCAPVHDALLVEGPADEIDMVVAITQAAMAEASRLVLSGFELRTEAKVVRWPERYMDDRGVKVWGKVAKILGDLGVHAEDVFQALDCPTAAPPVVPPVGHPVHLIEESLSNTE